MRRNDSILKSLSYGEIKKFNGEFKSLTEKKDSAIKLLDEYYDVFSEKVDVIFDNDKWVFKDLTTYDNVTLNFSKLRANMKFVSKEEVNNIILKFKIYLVDILNKSALGTSYSHFRSIYSAIISTNVFKKIFNDSFINDINNNLILREHKKGVFEKINTTELALMNYLSNIISFLEFNENENLALLSELISIRQKLNSKSKNRVLPNLKIFIEFEILINKWYEDSKYDDKLAYYPLLLWYNLCSVIPMRPSEFCLIEINYIEEIDGKCYITFPRLKVRRNKKNKKVILKDKIIIPQKLYNLFVEYKELTSSNSNRKFLIDYESYNKIVFKKEDYNKEKIFNFKDLNKLINKFYINYINNFTNFKVLDRNDEEIEFESIENEFSYIDNLDRNYILAGDLRHIAIINMMMQGYSELEIERLAGHITKQTQMGYAAHSEQWMDLEILKLQKELKKYYIIKNEEEKDIIIHPETNKFISKIYDSFYINKNYTDIELFKFHKIKIGYCTDEDMYCPTFNWKHDGCYFCDNWIITEEEFEEKENI